MVKWLHYSGKTPPSGWNKQAWDCLCQHMWLFWQQRRKAHMGFGEPRVKSLARFHVSQAKWKLPACLSELIRTHLQQMELPNLNGYLLFFHMRAGRFVRSLRPELKNGTFMTAISPCALPVDAESWVETRGTIKRWFKIHDHVNINLQISLVAIYRGSFSMSNVPLSDLQSDSTYLEVLGRRARQNFSHLTRPAYL